MRPGDEAYFERIEDELDRAFEVAEAARDRGADPVPNVEIPVAVDMAARVENILGIPGVAERVRELDAEYSREEAALELARDFAEGRVGDYETAAGKIEGAVRTAVALLTEGVVAAPIEGIDRVELRDADGGGQFVSVYYAGPIRSAGGTAQALSVLVADYTRSLLDIGAYQARGDEIERYAEEVSLYDDETGLQYSPSNEETKFIAEHCPVMLDGEATGEGEVQGYRDLERVATNASRGGMCLVLAEGIALKAPKIQRYTDQLEAVDWPWLQSLIDGELSASDEVDDEADTTTTESVPAQTDGPPRVTPTKKYLRDLIAGRPVFGHPSEAGGFRLRYGRARNHGFATAGVHPATMHLVDDFLATGTQLKTERPGKAAGVVPVDSIEGPTVRLANGDVRRIDDPAEAKEVRNGVEAILDLGEYLVNYGEFVENNHDLAPAGYVREWWEQELAAAGADVQALRDSPYVDLDDPTAKQALSWARDHDAPLHPAYTYCYHDVALGAIDDLADAMADARVVADPEAAASTDGGVAALDSVDPTEAGVLRLPMDPDLASTLEALLVEHRQREDAILVPDWVPLARTLGITTELVREWTLDDISQSAREANSAMPALREIAPFQVRERAPTRIGCRMGRPEKSESRELSPAVHTLFPIGEAGGDQRDVSAASKHAPAMNDVPGEITVELGERRCPDCGTETFRSRCPSCEAHTEPHYECDECAIVVEPNESGRVECPRCEREVSSTRLWEIDLRSTYREALDRVGERENAFEILKGVKGLTSASKVPEPLEKGILRAKHGVSAFKDGTVRYDMTDLPLSSVRPAEVGATAEQFRALGYEEDVHGDRLEHDDQLVYLKVQDVVISEDAADHLLNTAAFVDDLLDSYYDLEGYYDVTDRGDLIGELVFGLAPHTSAAVVGRVVGFTSAAVGYAHPYFHAAKRRNCFHPETRIEFRDEVGTWQEATIEAFVEERLEDPCETDLGTLVEELDREVRVRSLADDGRPLTKAVEAVSKHPAPDHLVEIETANGQSMSVTADHHMLRWTEGLETVPAHSIQTGDEIPIRTSESGRRRTGQAVADGGKASTTRVESVEYVAAETEHTYCLTVADTHRVLIDNIYTGQCDGDEDCVMLLMDGLLNFSKYYLPDRRGGRMDAPLVMSSRIDPTEIDDEAHNVDIVEEYPLAFYEATREMADPDSVDIPIAENTLETDAQYAGFPHTHDTGGIALGPDLSAYKTLEEMETKMDAQLELARRLRAVDETDVAERIIEYHFLPDLIGNLRAFAGQQVRCLDCGKSFRRPPLSGDCIECGGDVTLTVHEGSVAKYMDTALRVAGEYGAREYTKQRLDILERTLDSLFENDKNRPSSLGDFM